MSSEPKYVVGNYVIIDKMFDTKENPAGSMEELKEQRVAQVVEVSGTSTGFAYKLRPVGKPDLKFRACFWEEDIVGLFGDDKFV